MESPESVGHDVWFISRWNKTIIGLLLKPAPPEPGGLFARNLLQGSSPVWVPYWRRGSKARPSKAGFGCPKPRSRRKEARRRRGDWTLGDRPISNPTLPPGGWRGPPVSETPYPSQDGRSRQEEVVEECVRPSITLTILTQSPDPWTTISTIGTDLVVSYFTQALFYPGGGRGVVGEWWGAIIKAWRRRRRRRNWGWPPPAPEAASCSPRRRGPVITREGRR